MTLKDEIAAIVAAVPATMAERKGVFSFSCVVAERKAFLCRQKLVYAARFRIDEEGKELVFSEALKETGFGLGGGSDDDLSPGAGYRKSAYRTGLGPRDETIEERSTLLGKKYSYSFDFGRIRDRIRDAAIASGYRFVYKVVL